MFGVSNDFGLKPTPVKQWTFRQYKKTPVQKEGAIKLLIKLQTWEFWSHSTAGKVQQHFDLEGFGTKTTVLSSPNASHLTPPHSYQGQKKKSNSRGIQLFSYLQSLSKNKDGEGNLEFRRLASF